MTCLTLPPVVMELATGEKGEESLIRWNLLRFG